ncbi:MAG: alpha/beta fold hydrolase [Gammaproteobacteria bacterium]|nr:alpha/beta fold hydrolase [Gammaproteobacteria bacterium]
MRITTLITALTLVASIFVPAWAETMDVDLEATDGTRLKATYMSPGRPGPAMLLIHQCNMDRSSWSVITPSLVDAGIHVLTMDLRGFGDSEGDGLDGTGGFRSFMENSTADVDMAYAYLVGQAGVDNTRIAVGGASCGAMLTADLASRQSGVKVLMLLSGPPSDGAITHMAATSALAVFTAASRGDPITPGVADRLKGAVDGSKHPHSIARIYDGTEHGLPMFEKNADLQPTLIAWLTTELLGD